MVLPLYSNLPFLKDAFHSLFLMLSIFPCTFPSIMHGNDHRIICCVIICVFCPFMCWDRPLYFPHQSECSFPFNKCLYCIYYLSGIALSALQILTHLILAKTI